MLLHCSLSRQRRLLRRQRRQWRQRRPHRPLTWKRSTLPSTSSAGRFGRTHCGRQGHKTETEALASTIRQAPITNFPEGPTQSRNSPAPIAVTLETRGELSHLRAQCLSARLRCLADVKLITLHPKQSNCFPDKLRQKLDHQLPPESTSLRFSAFTEFRQLPELHSGWAASSVSR